MSRKALSTASLVFLLSLVLAACAPATATPYPSEVSWEQAIELLYSGKVATVVQAHSLDITIIMDDGSMIHTVEPSIDEIFRVIEQCGEPCRDIAQATE